MTDRARVEQLIEEYSIDTVKIGGADYDGIYRGKRLPTDVFLDGLNAKMRDCVHLIFAGEKVRDHEPVANPDVTESVDAVPFRYLSLEALVQIKLTAWRDKDRVHLRDLLDVGLIDSSWPAKYPAELAARLQHLIDNPES